MNKLLLIHGFLQEPSGSTEIFSIPAFTSEKSCIEFNNRIINTLTSLPSGKGELIGTS